MNDNAKPGDSDATAVAAPENADTGKSLDDLLTEFDKGDKSAADSKTDDQGEVAALKE